MIDLGFEFCKFIGGCEIAGGAVYATVVVVRHKQLHLKIRHFDRINAARSNALVFENAVKPLDLPIALWIVRTQANVS